MNSPVTIAAESPLQDDVRRLVEELNAVLLALTPPEFCYHMKPEEMAAANTTVFVARRDGRAVAMGALRRHSDGIGEVKRMYTRPEVQGQGIGGRILAEVERLARTDGLKRLVLETGDRHAAAWRVYERGGFGRCGPVLGYPDTPYSVFYAKTLERAAGMSDLTDLSVAQIRSGLTARSFSAVELARAYLANMEKARALNAYIVETPEKALAMAAESDRRIAAGAARRLEGVPLGIKDLFCTEGVHSQAASHILDGFKPRYEFTVTANLWADGAVMLGKLNMDEFAMGSSNETSYYGPVINPWRSTGSNAPLVPGGSSGGSASAVAARLCAAATATDTGGSIRQPAAFTGTVGIKPTYGRCSRWGIVAFASSLDQAGPIARDVRDAAIMLRSMASSDPKDTTSVERPVPDYEAALGRGVKGLRIGIPKEYRVEGMPAEIEALWERGKAWLKDAGAELVDISLPHTKYALPAYYIVAPAEASSNLARYDGVRYGLREPGGDVISMYEATRAAGFGKEVKRRIMIGTYVLSAGYYDAYYLRAQKVRTLIKRDFEIVFDAGVDAILTPATPSAAFGLEAMALASPIEMYLNDVFTVTVNMAGLPGIAVPAGTTGDGLPLGLQLIGRAFDEETLFSAAEVIEQAAGEISRAREVVVRSGAFAKTAARSLAAAPKSPLVVGTSTFAVAILVYYLVQFPRGIDANWDQMNYHVSSWLLLVRGGYFENVAPSTIMHYAHPMVHGIAVGSMAAFGPVASGQMVAVLHAAMMGVGAAVLAKLVQTRQAPITWLEGLAIVAAVSLLAATAPIPASMMGTTFVDNSLALLLALAYWQALRGFEPNRARGAWMAFLLALAVSAKFAVLPFALALGVCFYAGMAWVSGDVRRTAGEFAVFAVVSVAVCAVLVGPWAWLVYLNMGSPTFPFFNKVFHSSLFLPVNLGGTSALPQTWRQFFGYPLTMALGRAKVAEVPFTDVRYLTIALVFAALVAMAAVSRATGRAMTGRLGAQGWLLGATLLLAFLIWRWGTSIQRFFAVEDILLAVLLVWFVLQFPRAVMLPLLVAVVTVHLATVRIPDWGHSPVARPLRGSGTGIDDALVFLGEVPLGYAVASFGARTRFVLAEPPSGPETLATDATSGFAPRVRGLVDRGWTGGIWLVTRTHPPLDAYFRGYDLHATNECRTLQTHLEDLRVCRVEHGVAIQ